MPLLRRRHDDVAGAPDDGQRKVALLPERRRQRAGQRREIAVLFDAWGNDALAALKSTIQDLLCVPTAGRALPAPPLRELLARLHRQSGMRFLFVLDAFEHCLAAPPGQAGDSQALVEELLDVVEQTQLPAHFLLSLRSEAEPLLSRFRMRIPGFDHHFVRLPPRRGKWPAAASTANVPSTPLPQPALHDLPGTTAPRPPMNTATVYASIGAALAKSAAPSEPAPDGTASAPIPPPPPPPPPRPARPLPVAPAPLAATPTTVASARREAALKPPARGFARADSVSVPLPSSPRHRLQPTTAPSTPPPPP